MQARRIHIHWRYVLTALLLGLALGWVPLESWAQSGSAPGRAGFLSLRFGLGSRYAAMGETGVAEAADANAVWWNPANLAYAAGTQLVLQHVEHFNLFRQESLGVSHKTKQGGLGFLFSGFYSEELNRYDIINVGVPQGTFRPYDLSVSVSYGHAFKDLAVGATAKFLYQRIDTQDASGLAFDLGVTHRSQIKGLTLAAAVQNFGDQMVLDEEPYDLPLTFRLGGSFTPHPENGGWAEHFSVAADVVIPNDGNGRLHTGAEIRLGSVLALRGGYRFNYDTYGLTAGAGFRIKGLALDYAFMPNLNEFADDHKFSLQFYFM